MILFLFIYLFTIYTWSMWHWSAITKHTFINGAIMVFWVFRMFRVQFWSHLQADASSLLSAELVLVFMHYRNTQSCFEFFMSNDNALNRSNKMSKNWIKCSQQKIAVSYSTWKLKFAVIWQRIHSEWWHAVWNVGQTLKRFTGSRLWGKS